MGSEFGATLAQAIMPSDDSGGTLHSPPVFPAVPSVSAVGTPPLREVPTVEGIGATLDQVVADLSTIKRDVSERIHYDSAKEEAFNRLYAQLDELRSDREFDRLRPLYLDLILLFDRFDQSTVAALRREDTPTALAVLTSLREELIEVLYRREVELIDSSSSTFDPKWQRAIGTQESIVPEQHNSVGAVVRRGFRYRDRLIRPEEVILNKFRSEVRS